MIRNKALLRFQPEAYQNYLQESGRFRKRAGRTEKQISKPEKVTNVVPSSRMPESREKFVNVVLTLDKQKFSVSLPGFRVKPGMTNIFIHIHLKKQPAR
ncbi:MAG: hypothetical protein HQ517_15905 [SAR324 cluster bacterium]|nr:hypothetical protein [SAR324 cluster bacterium]